MVYIWISFTSQTTTTSLGLEETHVVLTSMVFRYRQNTSSINVVVWKIHVYTIWPSHVGLETLLPAGAET